MSAELHYHLRSPPAFRPGEKVPENTLRGHRRPPWGAPPMSGAVVRGISQVSEETYTDNWAA